MRNALSWEVPGAARERAPGSARHRPTRSESTPTTISHSPTSIIVEAVAKGVNGVLTIAKMGIGQEGYYLAKVASGLEDYYSGAGEVEGSWIGRGADRLGLGGDVVGADLRALLAGNHPRSDSRLAGRPGRAHTPGWDMTFSAPKSVSILYGLGGVEVAAQVAAAHDLAVREAVRWLEAHATVSRRRFGGQVTTVAGEGLVIASFRHRTSRLGDPQLHTHALAANVVERDDGTWGALDSRPLYRNARTAGYLYQAVLRAQLTQRLGVDWTGVSKGVAEIAGTDPQLRSVFSKRRTQIEESMAAEGETPSRRTAQLAAYRTRPAQTEMDATSLYARWEQEARDVGVDPHDVVRVTGRAEAPTTSESHLEEIVGDLVDSRRGLCASESTFDRGAMARAWCERLPPGTDLDHQSVEGLVDRGATDGRIVEVDPGHGSGPVVISASGHVRPVGVGERRWTTVELLAVERRMLHHATSARTVTSGIVDPEMVQKALEQRADLGSDQATMVHRLTTADRAVEIVVGRAGTGKTYALATAVDLWRSAGFQPVGVALAARAAAELEAGAGIRSTTVAQLFADVDRAGEPLLNDRSVLVVDEAAMVDTRRLAALLEMGRDAGAKVVLVGDHHQLPPVEVGGSFAALVDRLDPIELAGNRRQAEAWERDALARFRTGAGGHDGIRTVISEYLEHDRVRVGDNPAEVRAAMAMDWHRAHTTGENAAMVALRREDVRELNVRARALLVADGTLDDADAAIIDLGENGQRTFTIGDRVVCGRNDRRLGVHNALTGTVTAIDHHPTGISVTICGRDGTAYSLPPRYLEAGHLDHGYATSIHKAQGATVDRCLLLGDDRLYRQAGYTALSRGRISNDLYLIDQDERDQFPELELDRHGLVVDDDPVDRIVRAFTRDGAKNLASTVADEHVVSPTGSTDTLAELWQRWDRLADQYANADTDVDVHDQLRDLGEQIEWRTAQAARAAEFDRPERVTNIIGAPPIGDRAAWLAAAGAIESYNARWGDLSSHELASDPAHTDHHARVTTAV
ncbi:MAG: relaxase domain-containing protein, partial [Acidimicrobiales bacterium]|nr:relaxase domain-containing protein [Acidimicrobiales bacterium]